MDAGNGMIALHSRSENRFVRMDDHGAVDSKGGLRDVDALPIAWEWERFAVREINEKELAGKVFSTKQSSLSSEFPHRIPMG